MPAFLMNGVANANPTVGKVVLMSPFSGPRGSPFDAQAFDPLTFAKALDNSNLSTGALSTGIGFGGNNFDGVADNALGRVLPDQNFTDDYTPGVTKPDGTAATTSDLVAIGGGKSTASAVGGTTQGAAPTVPYTAGFGLLGFGGGGARDAGAGPTNFTGFGLKMVTAVGAVAVGAAVEAGFLNRTSFALNAGKSVFGQNNVASAAPA